MFETYSLIFIIQLGCCIFKKKREFGESESDDSADECDNCSGHVERKHQHSNPTPNNNENPPPPDIS